MEPTVYKSVNRWYNINIDDNKKKERRDNYANTTYNFDNYFKFCST